MKGHVFSSNTEVQPKINVAEYSPVAEYQKEV